MKKLRDPKLVIDIVFALIKKKYIVKEYTVTNELFAI